jgi:hypothetical protein
VPVVAAPPVPVAAPAPALTPYESFIVWIGDHVKNQTSGCNEAWVEQCMVAFGVADGKVTSLQNQTPEFIANVRDSIAKALGVPAL